MRHISFFLTTEQFRNRTKDVTRRQGWKNAQPGERLRACVKCQGMKKGEHMEILGEIEVVSNRREALNAITQEEVNREGFPQFTPEQFVAFYAQANGVTPDHEVSRIQFKYID